MRRARLLSLPLAVSAALALSACGQEAQDPGGFQTEIAYVAETEAIYVPLEGMKYQVQVSRQLNPLITSDRDYLNGIPEERRDLRGDQIWFGVWMRVENEVDEPRPSVEDFAIRDTQENVYRPVSVGPSNVFVYRPGLIQGGELYPDPDSPAGERQPVGAVLLFKLRRFSLDNRPLELVLEAPRSGERATVSLDV